MQADFWNNPLVVSAVRLKYRRGSPGLTTSAYMLALMGIGMLFLYYQNQMTVSPVRTFLVVVLSIQLALSSVLALFGVSSSINAEVVNRTLDFQRIVSLGPKEILLGKAIGEPALAYFFMMATVPFAVLCWTLGAVSAWAIVWFYVNLLTSLLMLATIGTLHTLVPPTTASGKQRGSGSLIGFLIVPMFFIPSLMAGGMGPLRDSWLGTAINLLTPLGSLIGLYEGDPWMARVNLWGIAIPSLYFAPIVQMGVASCVLAAMSRRLKNTIDPPITKPRAYAMLLVFDLFLAGASYSQWLAGEPADGLMYIFTMAHLSCAMLLLLTLSPSRAGLISWVWNIRARRPWLMEQYAGDRSPVSLVLPIFCAIGAVTLLVGFVLPTQWIGSSLSPPATINDFLEVVAVSSIQLLAVGFSYQFLIALGGKAGIWVFLVIALLVNLLPPLIALVLHERFGASREFQEMVTGLSPIAFCIGGVTSNADLKAGMFILSGIYLVLLFLAVVGLQRWMKIQESIVARKLHEMGIDGGV